MAAGAVSQPGGAGGEAPTFKAPNAAETASPAPPTNADETYLREAAKINHALETSLAGDKEAFTNAETTYNYQRALLAKEEPERYAANRWRGVREGISESGIQGGRVNNLASGFLFKGGQNLSRFQEAANRIAKAEQEQLSNRTAGLADQASALTNRRYLASLERENPQTPPAVPPTPAGSSIGTVNPRTGALFFGAPGNERLTKGIAFTPGVQRRAAITKARKP